MDDKGGWNDGRGGKGELEVASSDGDGEDDGKNTEHAKMMTTHR